jgi:large subunit ribosomal protein L2
MNKNSSLVYRNPITPSQRHVRLLNRKDLIKITPLKDKTFYLKNKAGRNNQGKLTIFTKGGGHKKKYRQISFNRTFSEGLVESIEYDPYRSSNIARIFCQKSKEHFYILAPEGLDSGHFISSEFDSKDLNIKIGNLFYLKDLPLGVLVHNIPFPNSKGGIARAAGTGAQLMSKDRNFCRLKLRSGEHRLFPLMTKVTLGSLSNSEHKLISLGKAGRSRWLNKRPSVRGGAMNPIDHTHGGGEGKTSGGRPSVTPWGKITKGQPTRKQKQNKLIVKNRKNK